MTKVRKMKNETRLEILKASGIYGTIISLILLYVYFVIVVLIYSGTMRYMSIQIVLLPIGIVSAVVFSYMHLIYSGKNSEEFGCPLLPGLVISVICIIPGFILVRPLFVISPGDWDMEFAVAGALLAILGCPCLVLGIFSAITALRGDRSAPKGLEQWKIRGLRISTAILIAGIVVSGISLSSGIIGKTEMTYEITLDASRIDTSEETTFLVPLPVDNSSGVAADVVAELTVIEGDAVWGIVDTEHGKALEVRTSTKCVLSAGKECGYMDRDEREEWLQKYTVSMIPEMDERTCDVWVCASNADATMRMKLWMDTGLGDNHCLDIDHTPLDEGWQTVKLRRFRLCYD